MNTILNNLIVQRKGIYVHALEVNNLYELTDTIEVLTNEFYNGGYSLEDIKEFFNTISIYYLGEDNKEEDLIFNFDIEEYIEDIF